MFYMHALQNILTMTMTCSKKQLTLEMIMTIRSFIILHFLGNAVNHFVDVIVQCSNGNIDCNFRDHHRI